MRHVALVVDDQDIHRALLRDVVTGLEHEALEARSQTEALAALAREGARVCYVLLDFEIPLRTGGGPNREFGRATLAQVLEKHQGVPVIMVTGFGELKYAVECLKGGAVDFAVKPIDANEEPLGTKIQEALRRTCARHGDCARASGSAPAPTRSYSQPDVRLGFHGEARGKRSRVDVKGRPVYVTDQGMEILWRLAVADEARKDGYLTGEELVGPGHKTAVHRLEAILAQQGVRGLIEKANKRYRIACPPPFPCKDDLMVDGFGALLDWRPGPSAQDRARRR